MSIGERLYTVEEFEAIADSDENRNRLLELINGEIVEKVPTFEHGVVVVNLSTDLNLYNRQTKAGTVVIEVRYRIPDDPHNARIPDISFYTGNQGMPKRGSVPYPPALAVEVKSPDDNLKQMREKAHYFLAHGTRLVWLVNPQKRLVEVYTKDAEEVLTEADTLTGGDVLPGFSMQVSAIFFDPAGREE